MKTAIAVYRNKDLQAECAICGKAAHNTVVLEYDKPVHIKYCDVCLVKPEAVNPMANLVCRMLSG